MPDWMRLESMRRDMMVTVVSYKGWTSGRILKTPAMSTDVVHGNAVFIRGRELTESLKDSIRRMLIDNRMDPRSPIHDVTKIWDSGPAIEMAGRIYDSEVLEELEPTEVKPKKQLPGIVSGSLDGIRAQFGRGDGQD